MNNNYYSKYYVIDANQRAYILDKFKKIMKLDDICTYRTPYKYQFISYSSSSSYQIDSIKKSKQNTINLSITKKIFPSLLSNINIELSEEELELWLTKGFKPIRYEKIDQIDQIDKIIKSMYVNPKTYYSLDRLSYFYKEDPSLIVNIDENIRFSKENFSYNQFKLDLLLPLNKYILNIININDIPTWLSNVIEQLNIKEIASLDGIEIINNSVNNLAYV